MKADKIKKSRSCSYPAIALNQAIDLAKKLFDNLGQGPHSRQNAARGLGYNSFSGAVSTKIGSLVQFGLLLRQNGQYLVSNLAKSAFTYPSEESEPAIEELAQKPALYQKLINKFSANGLPKELAAILTNDFKITKKAAALAAQNFIASMEFGGLLKDGILALPEFGNDNLMPKNLVQEKDIGESIKIKLASGIEIVFPADLSYRLSMGDFAPAIKELDQKANN